MADWTLDRSVGQVVVPYAAYTATAGSTSVDIGRPGVMRCVFVKAHAGVVSGTNPTLDLKLQDSADDANWADVAGATATQLTAAGNRVFCGFTSKRFVRVHATVGGTDTPTFTHGIEVSTLISE